MNENIIEKIEAFEKVYWDHLDTLEKRIESQETMLAMLTQGYAELAASTEAVLVHLSSDDPEAREQLEKALDVTRKKMIKVLNSEGVENDDV